MNFIIDLISQPWPWYVAGVMIAIIMLAMLLLGKSFGVSSNLRTMCSIAGAGNVNSFFKFNWKNQIWNLVFISGAMIGGAIASLWLNADVAPAISDDTQADLAALGIFLNGKLNPDTLFGSQVLSSFKGWVILIGGGFLVGFGARYAGGCTSGHAISGIANLQLPSVIAVVGFFVGGLTMTHLLLPLIF